MAHIVKRCSKCHAVLSPKARSCSCGGRRIVWRARYIDPRRRREVQDVRAADGRRSIPLDRGNREALGSYVDPAKSKEPLSSLWERWHARGEQVGNPAPSTLAKYEGVWRLHVNKSLGRAALGKITRADVEDALAHVTSPWQRTEALKLIRLLLNRAMDEGAITRNPAARIEAPELHRTRPRILTPTELSSLVGTLPERIRAFVMLDAYASLRWSELVAIKRDDIDLEARTVRVDEKLVEVKGAWVWGRPKTQRSARTVDLPEAMVRPLAEHLLRFPPLHDQEDVRLDGLVFYGERRGPVRRHSFRKAWNRGCAGVGLVGVRPEWLRHTGASLAYLATKDMKAVADRLGHTSTRMMDTVYVEVYAEASRAVADAIDTVLAASAAPQTAH